MAVKITDMIVSGRLMDYNGTLSNRDSIAGHRDKSVKNSVRKPLF
jgi:hypothetical protein